MPSYNGNLIIKAMAAYLGRKLTPDEVLCCEDMAHAVYTPAVVNEIHRMSKKAHTTAPTVDRVYTPIMNGMLVNAKRVPLDAQIRFNTTVHAKMYMVISSFLGDDFSQKDLDEIVGICKNATMEEVQTAIRASMDRGIRSASYIRSIIIGRRRVKKAQAAYERDRYKKVADPPPPPAPKTYAQSLTSHFKKVVKELEDEESIRQAAERKLRL